jgi:hypothetical protein
MADRQALAGELVTARSIELATMPLEEHEPEGSSRAWAFGVSGAAGKALLTPNLSHRRDLVVLAGARVIGWLEALDEQLETG